MVYPQRNERPLTLFCAGALLVLLRGSLFRRHSGERLHAVIPAEAGIHVALCLWFASRKPPHVRVSSFDVPVDRSLSFGKKVTKETAPRGREGTGRAER